MVESWLILYFDLKSKHQVENSINIYFPFYTVELKVEWPLEQSDLFQLFLL